MKVLFHLGHPAHFHLFKHVIRNLNSKGDTTFVAIKKKDILEDLLKLEGIEFENVLPEGRRNSKFGIGIGLIKQVWNLLRFCRKSRPDLLIGTSGAIPYVGRILGIKSINVTEDDAEVIAPYPLLTYPFSSAILAPEGCSTGRWEGKTVRYSGYHELAYLHPNHFSPQKEIVERYFSATEPYFLMRFARLNAFHDSGITGINNDIARKLIQILQPHGSVFISSERALVDDLEPYRIRINPLDIHHVLAFASLFVGDSQTMAAEAGVLGTPFVRFNDFVGRISYLEELENRYGLGYGIKTHEQQKLYHVIQDLVSHPEGKEAFQLKREEMLKDKIDVSEFITQYIRSFN